MTTEEEIESRPPLRPVRVNPPAPSGYRSSPLNPGRYSVGITLSRRVTQFESDLVKHSPNFRAYDEILEIHSTTLEELGGNPGRVVEIVEGIERDALAAERKENVRTEIARIKDHAGKAELQRLAQIAAGISFE